MGYTKIFDPKTTETYQAAQSGGGDQREGSVYVYTEEIILGVNVALATRRPLLVRGPSGGGKSSLARNVANVLNYRYYETVISSRTQARDLLWEVDLLRRLHDAQRRSDGDGSGSGTKGDGFSSDMRPYVKPGPLWWAFDRAKAVAQAGEKAEPGRPQPLEAERAVVLLDEIDKADPDVPNNLLVPLGSLEFQVEDIPEEKVNTTKERAPLVFITTNDERELPAAFLRRCVELNLPEADEERLIQIGHAHFPDLDDDRIESVADHIGKTYVAAGSAGKPSPAEYIDTLRACKELGITPGSKEWLDVVRMTLWKHGRSARLKKDGDESDG